MACGADALIIGGGNIKLTDIAQIVGKVEGLSMHFRMMARTENAKDRFIVEAETVEKISPEEMDLLRQELHRRLMEDKHEFAAFLKTGSILEPLVRIVEPDSLPRNRRTGKLKQVIDERNV